MKTKQEQRLYNSVRWKRLRADYLADHPLCERCKEQGFYVPAVDVHHRRPTATGRTPDEMERLCYSPTNLMALCIPCHVAIHKAMAKSTRDNHKQRAQTALERWAAKRTLLSVCLPPSLLDGIP